MRINRILSLFAILMGMLIFASCAGNQKSTQNNPAVGEGLYTLDGTIQTRSASFENLSGAKGGGGMAENHLGVGRKGAPCKKIAPGEEVTLCDVNGAGTIRHIWMTGEFFEQHFMMREFVIRAWWDGQEYPSIECPLGDFMGMAHARLTPYQSAVHSIGENAALNFWLPMPFTSNARITLKNEGERPCTIYYQVDYTIGDEHPEDVGRLHTLFRRENPTKKGEDFEILPKRTGKGRFIGTVLGVRYEDTQWWGEGEVKMYIDGDTEFPTYCGTGSEDYICLSYGVQETPYLYHGCTLKKDNLVSMYRWHLLDPVVWTKDIRVTIQQIGWQLKREPQFIGGNYYERQDDWCTATFWYEPIPSAPLPEFPSFEERTKDIRPLTDLVIGVIRGRWLAEGAEDGHLGKPLTRELTTADGVGRYNDFEHGAIYWRSDLGAHWLSGEILAKWKELKGVESTLGYPIKNQYEVPDGLRCDFEHGAIIWHREANVTTVELVRKE